MFKYIFKVLVKFYRKYITHIWKTSCAYTPTCSAYALEALEKRNVFVALFLIIKRIFKCNPLSKGGFDPVPDSPEKVKWVL